MNQQAYLEDPIIKDFINWTLPKISGDSTFCHDYLNSRDKTLWQCDTIYNAYENYKWRFSCSLPNKEKIKGDTYQESEETLNIIQEGLRTSLEQKNGTDLLAYCLSILEWGGVTRSNYPRLKAMGDDIVPYFENAIRLLDPRTANIEDDFSTVIMNSGFTKIYSLLIDDFVIYDSRVGAALGLLIKQFLEEHNIPKIPSVLHFAYGNARPTKDDKGKANRRNPSNDQYKFPVLTNNDLKHTKNNIYANWLLKELAETSMFNNESSPIRALEAALFMIGYNVRQEPVEAHTV